MSPRNKKFAQDLLNDKIDIQQIEDRLFAVMLLGMSDNFELNGQQLNEKQKLELSNYLVGEVFGLMGNSSMVLKQRLHPDYVLKINVLLKDSNSFDVCVEQINGQLISIRADQKIKYIGAGKWLVVIERSKL